MDRIAYSTIKADWLAQFILDSYSFSGPIDCRYYTRGMNDTYSVETASTKYMLRVYRKGWRSMDQVEQEIAFLDLLKNAGLSVAYPIADKQGNCIQEIEAPEGPRPCVLFSYAEGQPEYYFHTERMQKYRQLAGLIHQAADETPHCIQTHVLNDDVVVIEQMRLLSPWFENRPKDYALLQETAAELEGKFQALGTATPIYGLVHGDLHFQNVHFTDDHQITLFDFDHFAYGHRIYDIGCIFHNGFLFNEDTLEDKIKLLHDLITGYEKVRPLSAVEKQLIPWLVPIKILRDLGTNCRDAPHFGEEKLANTSFFKRQLRYLLEWKNTREAILQSIELHL